MHEFVTNELLLENEQKIVSLCLGDYLKRLPDHRMSYKDMYRLINPKTDERNIWFELPGANSDLFFALVKAIESISNNSIFPVFQRDKIMKIGVKFIGEIR